VLADAPKRNRPLTGTVPDTFSAKYAAADAQLTTDTRAVSAACVAAMQGYSQLIATFRTAAAKAMFDAATLVYNKGMAVAYHNNRITMAAADLAYTTGFDAYLNAYEHAGFRQRLV
jgi:hypothetical protein